MRGMRDFICLPRRSGARSAPEIAGDPKRSRYHGLTAAPRLCFAILVVLGLAPVAAGCDDTSAPRTLAVFTAVSAGKEHSCGLTAAGAASCWGYNGYGELGDGPDTIRTSPVAVSGGVTFTAVSAGAWHTCGVTPAGAAYCWGYNLSGELGDGTDTSRLSPVAVSGGVTFAAVSAGGFHS